MPRAQLMKVCPSCKPEIGLQPATNFYAHPQTADGLSGQCKACLRAARRARYARDPEQAKAYRQANRERTRAYIRDYMRQYRRGERRRNA